MIIFLCAVSNANNSNSATITEFIQSILAMVASILWGLAPICMALFTYFNKEEIRDPDSKFNEKYGTFFEDLDLERIDALMYQSIQMLVRMMFVVNIFLF
jgi:hypothetical protein